jgi:tetratricopeptide (TPR) repeat protein
MTNISKCLSENFAQIVSVYLGEKDKNQNEQVFALLDDECCDFYELSSVFKSRLIRHTYVDLLLNLGQAALKLGMNSAAEEIFEISIEECGNDEKLIDYAANANLELGKILALKFLWKESLLKIAVAKELYTKEKNYKSLFFCEALSGLIFEEIGGYLNARKNFANCLLLVNDKNDNEKMGFIFSNLGLLEFNQNNLESAISNFRRAEIYYQKSDNQSKVLEIKYNLSLLYLLIKDYNNAFREIEETIFNNETKRYFTSNDKIYVNKVKMFIEKNEFPCTIPLNHQSFDIYGFRASNNIIEYIYQLKTAISGSVNPVYKDYSSAIAVPKEKRSSLTII